MKSKKIKKFIKHFEKIPIILASHVLLSCLGLLFLALIVGGFLFYRYEYSIISKEMEPEVYNFFSFKEKTYQEVLKIWQEQEEKFKKADFKEHSDPFTKSTPVPEKPKRD